MIWIFDREDRLALVISNDLPEALPLIDGTMHEVLNGDINLEFEVPLDHKNAALIEEGMGAAIQRENGEYELFIISEIQTIKGSEETIICNCRHAIQELKDEIITDYFADRKEASTVLPDLLLGTRWEAGIIQDTSIHDLTVKNESVLKALTTFIERWEGEVSYHFEITSAGIVKREINFTDQVGWHGDNPLRRFEWNRDLIEVTRVVNEENIKTALIGIGQKADQETTEEEPTPPPAPDPTYNTNLLTAGQQIPDTKYDLQGWTWGGSVTETISSSVPSGLGSDVTTSLYITQAEESTDFMVINSAERKTRVTAGQEYTGSVYVKCNQAKQVSVWLEFYPSGAGDLQHFETKVNVAANTWTRITVTGTAPAKSYSCMLEARCYAPAIGTQLFWTAAKLEIGDIATPFDKPAGVTEPTNQATASEEDKILLFTDLAWTTPTDPADKPAGQSFIEDPAAREKYGRLDATTGIKRNRIGFYQNNDVSDAEDLLNETWEALQIVSKPSVSYKLKVLDLAKVEGLAYKLVLIGDEVAVIDEDLGELMARCLEIKHNLLQAEDSELLLESFLPMLTGGGTQDPSIRLDELEIKLGEKLDRGETIYSDWLEAEMAILTERVLAGAGTVTITDTEGILIEEDPINKQGGALRLLGGMLALADTFDFRLNTYNWRAFGTGEGFLADLVETGFIRFDRAKGGTLQLGGEILGVDAEGNNIYENGQLVVYGSEVEADGRPIVVNLNGDQGGFDRLSIGELTRIETTNILTRTFDGFLPENKVGDQIHFYVDPIDGDDNNAGTTAAPKLTIQNCIDALPNLLERDVYIFVLPTLVNDSEIMIEGIMGHGYIYIQLWDVGAKTRYIRDWISGNSVNNGKHWTEIRGIKASDGGIVHGGGNTYPERMRLLRGDTLEDITATNGVNLSRASDGDLTYNLYATTSLDVLSVLDVYLGGLYDLKAIESFHYWTDARTYHDTKIQISEDGGAGRWYTIFDSARQGEYVETAAGKNVQLKYFILNGRIKVNTCTVNVRCNNAYVNGEGVGNPTIDCFHTNFFEMRDSVVFGDPNYDYAVYANGSNVRLINNEVNTAKTAGITAAYGGRVEVQDVVGSGFPYAVYAHSTGTVAGAGKAPIGTTAHTRIMNGGRLTATWTHTGGAFLKAPIVQKTTQWTANDTQSLFGSNWNLTSYLYQGKRPTESTAWYGVMFFNARDFSALQGRQIKSVRLKLQRSSNTGENTSRKPKIYYNGQYQASGALLPTSGGHTSSVGFTWGAEKWITLPISYGEAFRDGTAKSLVLWVGTSESEYMKMEPKATLEITHG